MSSFIHLIVEGGLVMGPLIFASVVACYIFVERWIFFRQGQIKQPVIKGCLDKIQSDDKEFEQELEGKPGLLFALLRVIRRYWGGTSDTLAQKLKSVAQIESAHLEKGLNWLSTIITAAPLIGLFGTITGMMGVFRVVSEKLASNPDADTTGITAGIGEALIATATGILVALLALLFHNWLESLADKMRQNAQYLATQAIELHEEQHAKES